MFSCILIFSQPDAQQLLQIPALVYFHGHKQSLDWRLNPTNGALLIQLDVR